MPSDQQEVIEDGRKVIISKVSIFGTGSEVTKKMQSILDSEIDGTNTPAKGTGKKSFYATLSKKKKTRRGVVA